MPQKTIKTFLSAITAMILLTCMLTACNSEKKLQSLVYFNEQGDTTLAKVVQNNEPIIQPGDRLSITVNALNPASAAPYNLGSSGLSSTSSASGGTAATGGSSYIVEADGTIQFPQLGKMKVAG